MFASSPASTPWRSGASLCRSIDLYALKEETFTLSIAKRSPPPRSRSFVRRLLKNNFQLADATAGTILFSRFCHFFTNYEYIFQKMKKFLFLTIIILLLSNTHSSNKQRHRKQRAVSALARLTVALSRIGTYIKAHPYITASTILMEMGSVSLNIYLLIQEIKG